MDEAVEDVAGTSSSTTDNTWRRRYFRRLTTFGCEALWDQFIVQQDPRWVGKKEFLKNLSQRVDILAETGIIPLAAETRHWSFDLGWTTLFFGNLVGDPVNTES